MNMNIYITPDNEKKLRTHDGSMSGLINGLLEGYFNDTLPPVKREVKESPPVIRNLAEVIEEGEELYGTPRYDKAKPFWSPFGPLPVKQNPLNPTAVIDPNYDDERQMPLDVDKRNAYIERDE